MSSIIDRFRMFRTYEQSILQDSVSLREMNEKCIALYQYLLDRHLSDLNLGNGFGVVVPKDKIDFALEGHRGEYRYAFFSFVDSPAELLPLAKRRHKTCIGLLKHNQNTIACGVIRELTHIPQALLVTVRLEYSLKAVIDLLE